MTAGVLRLVGRSNHTLPGKKKFITHNPEERYTTPPIKVNERKPQRKRNIGVIHVFLLQPR